MRMIALFILAALTAAGAPRSALAEPQFKPSVPLYQFDNEPSQVVGAAFSAPFGQLLVAEFATVLGGGADAACLDSKRIEKASLIEHARAILLRQGAQVIRTYTGPIDRTAFHAKLAARMGADADAERARLRDNPDVREYIALVLPMTLAETAHLVLEALDRNVLILKIKLRSVGPHSTGIDRLIIADPSHTIPAKLESFVANRKTPALARYLELTAAAQEALNESIDVDTFLRIKVVDMMSNLEKDFADVCVLGRR